MFNALFDRLIFGLHKTLVRATIPRPIQQNRVSTQYAEKHSHIAIECQCVSRGQPTARPIDESLAKRAQHAQHAKLCYHPIESTRVLYDSVCNGPCACAGAAAENAQVHHGFWDANLRSAVAADA